MGRKSKTGGITVVGNGRIQFDFTLDGVRYRPTLARAPIEANLKKAREELTEIKRRIRSGTFSFSDAFPDFQNLHNVIDSSKARSCDQVFDEYLLHCEARVAQNELAPITLRGYRDTLRSIWQPSIGTRSFLTVTYPMLFKVAGRYRTWSKKRYNNAISVLRRAFAFGYHHYPDRVNPASALKCIRMSRRDKPRPDPFSIPEAEALIVAIREDWGAAQANYDEFRFFTGLRPSEQIALTLTDYNRATRTLMVTKACVDGIHRNTTKTHEDRVIHLCPRAVRVLDRQAQLRERLQQEGRIRHDRLFFKACGQPIRNLIYPGDRWRKTLERLPIRYRRPYCARHSSVSWNLMAGRNPLQVASEHGHRADTMWRFYAAWINGTSDADIQTMRRAMGIDIDPAREQAASYLMAVWIWQWICQWNRDAAR